MRLRFLILIITLFVLTLATFLLMRYGQGYRLIFNKNAVNVAGTGLLVATSNPDGASIFVDGHLTSATNTTINLPPGDYTVKIIKEGYLPWEKKLKMQKEVVTQTQALLFPSAPRLESITSTGVLHPVVDPTGTRITFGVASASAKPKNGIFVLDMGSRPILAIRNASFQIADDSQDLFSSSQLTWSPDGQELLATTEKTKSIYHLNASEFNKTPQDTTTTVNLTKAQWQNELLEKEKARLESLKPALSEFINKNFRIASWSPDDTKILYEASDSAKLSSFIDPPLIGANTQPEDREIKKGRLYVYDTKEDKNFSIKETEPTVAPPGQRPFSEPRGSPNRRSGPEAVWFPDNRHLVFIEEKQIKIVEYDNGNKTTVYSGPFEGNFVYPWPDGSRLVILTSLNPQAGVAPNLYTINLR